jgi:hypothetical protein
MVVPFLITLALGTYDLGMGWQADITLSNATRAGARVASSLGVANTADYAALVAIGAALGRTPTTEVERVVVFKASSAAGTAPSGCLTASALSAGGSATDSCSVYSSTELAFAIANPNSPPATYTGTCPGTRRDRFWCAPGRNNTQVVGGTGLDYLGVYIKVNHATSTKLFGSTIAITDTAVMRLEPSAGNP